MLRQALNQKLQQKLSPQQIQMVKLLEVPALEMGERIKNEVDENPALELGEDPEAKVEPDSFDESDEGENEEFLIDGYAADDDIPDYRSELPSSGAVEKLNQRIPFSDEVSLNEYLQGQLALHDLDSMEKTIADYLIGSIDDDGYLRRTIDSISDDLVIQFGLNVSLNQIEELVSLIKSFDPPGVGAIDLQDCLLLQLSRKPQSELIKKTTLLLETCFDEVSKKHYDAIIKKIGCNMDELKKMIQEIIKLNPKPGNIFSSSMDESKGEVTPDFLLDNNDGILQLTLNNNLIPELHINPGYARMVNDYNGNVKNQTHEAREAIQFAKQKVDSARWFIDAVHQRQETLMRTMQAIIDYQYAFFIYGDEKTLKPMILKDIAERTGYDISTISRVSNSKYIQTEFGIFSLKYFFTEAMQTDSGEEVSVLEIKNILRESVDQEDKSKPFTDEELSEILVAKGYVIARRTIAKYRDQLGIPVARLRREI
jgi:RNA polymerase sigma-54 factor